MPDRSDDFFVGYLPTPLGLKGFLRAVAIVLIIAFGATAAIIAFGQRDPGSARWLPRDEHGFIGVVSESPYPMLYIRKDSGPAKPVLLVDPGKHGVATRVAGLNGKTVHISGSKIERGAFAIIELADDPAPIRIVEPAHTLEFAVASEPISVRLRGEIIDPKCHSGAMKPGDGKTHKACAILCIRGGIPPVFLDVDGLTYLLVDDDSKPLAGGALAGILRFVGDPVEVSGIKEPRGDLTLLRIAGNRVRRQ